MYHRYLPWHHTAITLWIKWLPSNVREADHFCTIKTGHCWSQIDYRQRGTEREQGNTSQKSIYEMTLWLLCKNLHQTSNFFFFITRVWNVASYCKDRTQIDEVTKEGTEEDIWMKWEERNGDCKNPHREKPYNLYFSPDVSRVIKSRRMMCQGYAAQNGRSEMIIKFESENPKERDHLQDQCIKRRRILN